MIFVSSVEHTGEDKSCRSLCGRDGFLFKTKDRSSAVTALYLQPVGVTGGTENYPYEPGVLNRRV